MALCGNNWITVHLDHFHQLFSLTLQNNYSIENVSLNTSEVLIITKVHDHHLKN